MAKKKAKAAEAAGDAQNESQKAAGSASQAAGGGKQKQAKAAKGQQDKKASQKAASEKKQDKQQAQSASLGDKIGQLKEFFEESKVELKKVTWPSRKETISTCVAVIVLTIVMSIYLGVVDWGLSKIVSFILS